MAKPLAEQESELVLKFGAGLATRASPDAIDPRECVEGKNFWLDVDNDLFSRRPAFDLAGTAPNAEAVRGFAQLEKNDGTLSTLVQAGTTVYEWDGGSGFTSVGTVNSAAKLRGPLEANFKLDQKAIITDAAKADAVKTWDGTTFEDMTTGLSGKFRAKYAFVENERAFFGNCWNLTDLQHVLVASERGNINNLSVSDRPSSSIGEADPWFLPIPDLRAINGLLGAFGQVIVSTNEGRIFNLSGTSSQNFALSMLYPDSGASGDESIAFIGNDVAYVRPAHVESLFATSQLGDVETDDLSRKISTLLLNTKEMMVSYCPRGKVVYFFDIDGDRVFVYHKSFRDELARKIAAKVPEPALSPWSLWTTDYPSAFQPLAAMNFKRPTDGLRTCHFGGPNGEVFQMGGGGGQDGGANDIEASRTSRIFELPQGRSVSGVEGWIRYRKQFAEDVTLTFQFGGETQKDETVTVSLPAASNIPVYGGGLYYNNDTYYGTKFTGRFSEQKIAVPGITTQVQLKVSFSGSTEVFIEEIGLRFTASETS